MGALELYLIKSVVWLTGFALVYFIFLRNERFFELNRTFLFSGAVAALIFPFITITYKVVLPAVGSGNFGNPVAEVIRNNPESISVPDFRSIVVLIYFSGMLFVAFMILKQGRALFRAIKKNGKMLTGRVKVVRSDEYLSAFSFFSCVFINPSTTNIEIKEIMNHEMVHISQKHWLDLILVELLCIIQWFNPVIWIYLRFMRQNHEYIADKVALQRTSDPAIYRAALLNQIVGSQVISLVNSFNYSLNKKRFNMMNNIINSPYRKMKMLFILPVLAIVFYAFARPDYQYISQSDDQGNQNTVSQASGKKINGIVVQNNDGEPLPGAHVIFLGTTIGTTTDENGNFKFGELPGDARLAVTFVGFKTKVVKPDFTSAMTIRMMQDTISLNEDIGIPAPPPPPPPPPSAGNGDKGKDGVNDITTKKTASVKETFVAVEELPEFPGGNAAMQAWLQSNLKYPADDVSGKVAGKVYVTFIVTSKGKIKTPIIKKSLHPLLDLEAIRLVSSMPDWKPGTQDGKAVGVQMIMPVEFKLQ